MKNKMSILPKSIITAMLFDLHIIAIHLCGHMNQP